MDVADHTEFLESLDVISIEADFESFQILSISATVEDVLGYPSERCREPGFFLGEFIHPADAELTISTIVQAFEDGRAETQVRAVHRDGSPLPFHVMFGSDNHAADGPRFRGLFVRSDRAAAGSTISEERLQLALESADMGVWDWNILDAHIHWSEQLYRLHGCTPEEIGDILENYTMLVSRIHPDDFASVQEIVMRSLRTGEDYDIEYRFFLPDESYRWLYVRGRMYFDADHNPVRIAGTAQDVTVRKEAEIAAKRELEERERAEAALKRLTETLEQRVRSRTEDLESANAMLKAEVAERGRAERELERANRQLVHSNRELQDFAYVASHDLKEPLRKIATFADLLRMEAGVDLTDDAVFYIDRMQESAARMLDLITALLDFSRIQTSGAPFMNVVLNEIVGHVLSDLDIRIRETNASIQIGHLPTITADPTQMRQLFQNLISNALKFRREDTSPIVSVRSAPLDDAAGRGEEKCRIVVEDNGIGFDQQYADRVFSPFQRLHTSYEGTGIGLAICRRIVERHHGTISVASVSGKGTVFTIDLPARQPKRETSDEEE